jgi:steroid delta-isomerase
MTDEGQIRAAVDAYVEAWRRDDREALLALWAEECLWEDPVGSDAMKGRQAVAEFWDKTHGNPMQLQPELDRVIVCGNEAMVSFVMHVRGPDGGGLDLFVSEHFVFDDACKIVQARAFWDDSCRTIVPAS